MREELDYEQLYREYAPRVHALARRKLSGRHLSDDVVQEVFLRAFRAADAIDPDRPMWPLLRRITLNVCTDVLRAPRTWAEESVSDVPERRSADDDPAAGLMAAEQRALILDALNVLPPRHQEVLLRRVVDGVSSEVMARDEGSTIEAVKSAVKRSRSGFRRAYTELGNDRGLLGIPAASREAISSAGLRLRIWTAETGRRVGEHPALQSLPAAVAAAVLLFGAGGGAHVPGVGAELAAGAPDVLMVARAGSSEPPHQTSPSSAANPGGGGMPPSPPPGNSPNGNGKPPAAKVKVESGMRDKRGGQFHLRDQETVLGYDAGGYTEIDMACSRNAARTLACDVLNEADRSYELEFWS